MQLHPHLARRAAAGPATVASQHDRSTPVARFNAWLAVVITRYVGTMYAFYLFNVIALLSAQAAFNTHDLVPIVNWLSSNWIQLVLLPAILVGQNVQAAAADKRAADTYNDTEAIIAELVKLRAELAAK